MGAGIGDFEGASVSSRSKATRAGTKESVIEPILTCPPSVTKEVLDTLGANRSLSLSQKSLKLSVWWSYSCSLDST